MGASLQGLISVRARVRRLSVLAVMIAVLVPTAATARDGYLVAADGGKIHYRDEGNGPPVVLLHSAFSSLSMWSATLPALAGRRVIRFDARGHGGTPLAQEAPLGADDLLAVMDALHVARADLVGSSMGGSVAFDFTLLHPERVDRLVLAGAAPIGGSPPSKAEIKSFLDIFAAGKTGGTEAGIRQWVGHPMNSAASGAVRREIARFARQSPAMFALGTVDRFPIRYLQPFAMDRIAEVSRPVLIVIGGRDLPTMRANAARAAAGLRHGRLVVFPSSGHFPSLEDPRRFNALIGRFLTIPRRKGDARR